MTRIMALTAADKRFIAHALAEAERIAGKKLNRTSEYIIINRAKELIYAKRHNIQPEPQISRQDTEFVWTKPRPFRQGKGK